MTNWTISAETPPPSVTLPQNPHRVTMQYNADFGELRYPTLRSMVISYGRKVDMLRIEGVILNSAMTKLQLKTEYLDKLEALVYKKAVIDDNDTGVYDGTWIMSRFLFREIGGFTVSYEYELEFIRGDLYLVLS